MTYTHCIDCGKEKLTPGTKQSPRCRSCRTHSEETRRKISIAHKGKTLTQEHKVKISIVRGGDGKLEERKYPGYDKWARLVKDRDGYKCAECGYQGTKGLKDVDAHHVLHKVMYPEYATVLFNGVTLCKSCHINCHKERGI